MSKVDRYKTSLIPIYQRYDDQLLNEHAAFRAFAVKIDSESYEKFDNEGDYGEYTPLVFLLVDLTWVQNYFKYDYMPYNNYEPDSHYAEIEKQYGSFKAFFKDNPSGYNQYMLDKNRAEIFVLECASEYLFGNKNKITDENILAALDKYYYDEHPNEWNYWLDHTQYGKKIYKLDNGKSWAGMAAKEAGKDEFYLVNNTPLPAGTLILDSMFF